MSIWERFENIVSKDEVADVKAQSTPLEPGEYLMILESIEAGESKSQLPMLKGQFRMVDGNRKVYYNQMLQNVSNPKMTAVNVNEAVRFVEGLIGEEIEFDGLGGLAKIVENIPAGGTYNISVSYGKSDYEQKFAKLKVVGKLGEELENPFL